MKKPVASTRTMIFAAFCLAALIQPTRSQAGLENCTGDLTPSNVDNPIVELNTNMGSI